jgi:hypothetical protein
VKTDPERPKAVERPFSNKSLRSPAVPGLEEAPDPECPWAPNRRASYSVVDQRTQRPENR